MAHGLTLRQIRFVQEYLVDGNGARAAVAAGYGVAGSRVAACRLLTRDNVQKALQARQAADTTRLAIRRDDVLKGLLEAVERAREQGDPGTMVRGYAEIGRMMGFYPAKQVQVDVNVDAAPTHSSLHRLSDSQLMEIVERGSTQGRTPNDLRTE